MIDDQLEEARALASVWDPVPIRILATWAVIGVVGIVLFVRLHQGHFGVKRGVALLALGAAALLSLCAAGRAQPTACYKHVDEVVRERGAIRSHRHDLMVHGLVVPGSLEQRAGTDEYRFRLESRPDRPPAVIEVRYTGLLPDAVLSATALAPFRRVQIIARGTLARDGRLDVIPDGIIAKRPYD